MSTIVFEGGQWSPEQLRGQLHSWKHWLRGQGLEEGARVGVLAFNRPETVALLLACGELRLVLVPFNARLTAVELAPLVAAAEPALVLADDGLVARIAGARPFPALPAAGPLGAVGFWEEAAPEDDQPLAGLFTSGTTGRPSLIVLTQGNFRASARASAANLGGTADQRWLLCLPLFHVGGLAMAHRCAQYGATLVIEQGFEPARVNARIDAGEATHLSLVPTALDRLLEARSERFPSSLRAVLIGGGPVPLGLMERARALGAPVLQTYGLTEACSQVATERPAEADGATAGPPLPGLEVRIVDGEIQVRGPTVAPQLGAGWLSTGDLGVLDSQGRLIVLARRTDLIVSGGENVYPAELERVLAEHPAIREVAVGARADPRWGQVPAAVIVWREAPVPEEVLVAWCRERLAGFKVPRTFSSAPALPRNASGKLDRALLRALVA